MEMSSSADGDKDDQPPSNLRPSLALLSLATVTILVSLAFIEIARPFLGALALAAICAVLVQPFYRAILARVGNRQGLASTITVLVGSLLVVGPLIGIAYLASSQAAGLIKGAGQLFETLSADVESIKGGTYEFPEWVPFQKELTESGPQIFEKIKEILGSIASFLAASLSGLTNGTASFFLSLFTFLYALFFFLPMESSAFRPILANSGLTIALQDKLHDRIVSVSRATIKGTLLIGVIQGALGGFGFWLAGIEGAAFWSVVMAIAAAIPGIGATGVVVGGAIFLALQGAIPAAIGLAAWAFLVVGTIDNVLRPTLVGRDAQMSDLMIFVSTLGGLALFGASGLIFGPVIAGVFVTSWQAIAESSLGASGAISEEPVVTSSPEEAMSPEPARSDGASSSRHRSLKLSASKDELNAQVESLKKELNEKDPS